MNDQLSLFPLEPVARESPTSALAAAVEARDERCRALQARLPPTLRMGTSSWSFPGWAGIVYPRSVPASVLAREGLREYARRPLLRTVGIDRSYYAAVRARGPAALLRSSAGRFRLLCQGAGDRNGVHHSRGRQDRAEPRFPLGAALHRRHARAVRALVRQALRSLFAPVRADPRQGDAGSEGVRRAARSVPRAAAALGRLRGRDPRPLPDD